MVKFYRGLKADYAPSTTHLDGIYFASDTKELLMNGNAYGINNDSSLGDIDDRLDVLEGDSSTEGSVAYQIAQIVAGADASFDTLKEIADWILSDTTGAAKMASDISSLSSDKADKVASATSGNFAGLDSNGNLTDSGKKASDFQAAGSYKTTQTAKTDPTASGNSLSFIDSITQDTNGEITATKKTVYSASGSQEGLMSSSDFTKLSGIESGAQVNIIETIKVGNDAQTVTSKTVSLGTAAGGTIETTGVSSNTTTLPTTAQVKAYVDDLLSWINVPAA